MVGNSSKRNIHTAVSKLRSIIWSAEEGELLGSEEDLIQMLGVSRPTVRQSARLLEREGLLLVRRGINGGYFAARPSIGVIESAVSAYLKTVAPDEAELAEITSALWAIAVQKAATMASEQSRAVLSPLRDKVLKLKEDASFFDMWQIEEASRTEVFKLVDSPYIELIFHINRTFSAQHFAIPGDRDEDEEHREFIKAWKRAKLLELEAIMENDPPLAELAAKHTRSLFYRLRRGYRSC